MNSCAAIFGNRISTPTFCHQHELCILLFPSQETLSPNTLMRSSLSASPCLRFQAQRVLISRLAIPDASFNSFNTSHLSWLGIIALIKRIRYGAGLCKFSRCFNEQTCDVNGNVNWSRTNSCCYSETPNCQTSEVRDTFVMTSVKI